MPLNRQSADYPTPTGVCPYFDKLQFWVCNPLGHSTLAWLREQCGRGGLYVENKPARFNGRFRQRIELRQPSDQALRWLARHEDALINRVEITIDLAFESLAERDDMWEFFHRHIVRRWHGRNQEIRAYRAGSQTNSLSDFGGLGDSRYDAGGSAPNKIVFYREEHSRITGEAHCLHLEWRLKGLAAVRRAGIESGRDLPGFDHRGFWQKRLQFYDVDRRRLGRMINNRNSGKKRRAHAIKQIGQFSINLDGRTGEVFARSFETIQELIDHFKSSHKIHRVLVPIPTDVLLPA
jgi:hypothetical protein